MLDMCFLYRDYQSKCDEGVYSGCVTIYHRSDSYVVKLSLFEIKYVKSTK